MFSKRSSTRGLRCSSVWAERLAEGYTNQYTKYGKQRIYYSKLDIEKCEAHTEQTRLIVCERPLQEHTHTWAVRYHPQGKENDAPKYSVYVCVVCVGGARSIENILLSQRVPKHIPNTTPRQENRSPKSVYIDNVNINAE